MSLKGYVIGAGLIVTGAIFYATVPTPSLDLRDASLKYTQVTNNIAAKTKELGADGLTSSKTFLDRDIADEIISLKSRARQLAPENKWYKEEEQRIYKRKRNSSILMGGGVLAATLNFIIPYINRKRQKRLQERGQ